MLWLGVERLAFPLPVPDVVHDNLGGGLRGVLAANTFDEVTLRV